MTETKRALEDLRTAAHRALTDARQELEKTGSVTPLILVQEPEGWQGAALGGDLSQIMNSRRAKAGLYQALRAWIEARKATGVIFVTDAWIGVPTERQKALDPEELWRRTRGRGIQELAEEGLVTREEALIASAQGPEEVWTLQLPYERHEKLHIVTFGQVLEQRFLQSQFFGPQKMFGDLSPENLR